MALNNLESQKQDDETTPCEIPPSARLRLVAFYAFLIIAGLFLLDAIHILVVGLSLTEGISPSGRHYVMDFAARVNPFLWRLGISGVALLIAVLLRFRTRIVAFLGRPADRSEEKQEEDPSISDGRPSAGATRLLGACCIAFGITLFVDVINLAVTGASVLDGLSAEPPSYRSVQGEGLIRRILNRLVLLLLWIAATVVIIFRAKTREYLTYILSAPLPLPLIRGAPIPLFFTGAILAIYAAAMPESGEGELQARIVLSFWLIVLAPVLMAYEKMSSFVVVYVAGRGPNDQEALPWGLRILACAMFCIGMWAILSTSWEAIFRPFQFRWLRFGVSILAAVIWCGLGCGLLSRAYWAWLLSIFLFAAISLLTIAFFYYLLMVGGSSLGTPSRYLPYWGAVILLLIGASAIILQLLFLVAVIIYLWWNRALFRSAVPAQARPENAEDSSEDRVELRR